jgi:hypothetical protein
MFNQTGAAYNAAPVLFCGAHVAAVRAIACGFDLEFHPAESTNLRIQWNALGAWRQIFVVGSIDFLQFGAGALFRTCLNAAG